MPYNIHQLEFFFTHKIWFINEEKFSPVKKYAFNALRKLVLTAECYLSKHLNSHASALTYSTILAPYPTWPSFSPSAGDWDTVPSSKRKSKAT